MSATLRVTDVTKTFRSGDDSVPVLRGVSLQVQDGSLLAVLGPSGCGKTLIAELGLRGVNGSFIRLASSRPVRLPAAGREAGVISERVELVLVDEPGSPPQVVEVAPQHTEPAEAGHAGRESQPRDPEATTDRASPGRSAFARTGPGGVMIAPRRVINSVFSGADYYRQPWSWSGGPMPGSSSGESD